MGSIRLPQNEGPPFSPSLFQHDFFLESGLSQSPYYDHIYQSDTYTSKDLALCLKLKLFNIVGRDMGEEERKEGKRKRCGGAVVREI